MNILIVEDEPMVANAIKKVFVKNLQTNVIHIAHHFDHAFEKISSEIFDIILVDINLGKQSLSGLDLCKTIRKRNQSIPIIVITAMNSIQYLEDAFCIGVSDYIKKPFNPKELELRVKRWQELFQENIKIKKTIEYEGIVYHIDENEFFFENDKISLTKKNKQLLKIFIESAGKVVSTDYVKQKFWGDYLNTIKNRNLRSSIQLLRKALGENLGKWLQTARGEGYVLKKI
jgi:DNA-binding response OmpR family regulator